MRWIAVLAVVAGLIFTSHARANEQSATVTASAITAPIVLAQAEPAKPKKKIQWRRTCSADQVRCACADTGTSACCKPMQACVCQMGAGAQCR